MIEAIHQKMDWQISNAKNVHNCYFKQSDALKTRADDDFYDEIFSIRINTCHEMILSESV